MFSHLLRLIASLLTRLFYRWDGISAMYADSQAPARIALEMRLTGGSGVILAPQRGNEAQGTASIEALTTLSTPRNVWDDFRQNLADKWTDYKDPQKKPINARPHWAKEWQGLQVPRGQPVEEYLKKVAYNDAIPEFKQGFEKIVTARGSSVEETRKRFAPPILDQLIFG